MALGGGCDFSGRGMPWLWLTDREQHPLFPKCWINKNPYRVLLSKTNKRVSNSCRLWEPVGCWFGSLPMQLELSFEFNMASYTLCPLLKLFRCSPWSLKRWDFPEGFFLTHRRRLALSRGDILVWSNSSGFWLPDPESFRRYSAKEYFIHCKQMLIFLCFIRSSHLEVYTISIVSQESTY